MSEPTYHLHPTGEAQIVEAKKRFARYAAVGLLTPDQSKRAFLNAVAEIMAQARVENNDTRMITAICGDCRREHRMLSDVIEYRCKCNPNKVRFAWGEQSTQDSHTFEHLRDRDARPF